MKKMLKYQMVEVRNSLLAFSGIYLVLTIVGTVMAISTSGDTKVISGFEFAEIIFCFVMGISLFKEYYWMAAQNSISRKTYYKGTLCTIVMSSVFMSLLSVFFYVLFGLINDKVSSVYYSNVIESLYEISNTPAAYLINILFSAFTFTSTFLLGYFVALIFYKANKVFKVLIAAGIPITLFMLLPMLFYYFNNLFNKCVNLIIVLFGINTGNPICGITTMLVISIIIATINYPIIKKAQIANHDHP